VLLLPKSDDSKEFKISEHIAACGLPCTRTAVPKRTPLPCKMSWMRSGNEPAERFRSHETAVCFGTSFLPDRWIVLALPSERPRHETRPVLPHSESVLEGLAAYGCHEPAQSCCRERQRQPASVPKRVGLASGERMRRSQAAVLALEHPFLVLHGQCLPAAAATGFPRA
jgi:hypothetical protein